MLPFIMHPNIKTILAILPLTLAISSPSAMAAKKAAPAITLTAEGKQLEKTYAGQLADLNKELRSDIGEIDQGKKAAYLKAREAQLAAEASLTAAEKRKAVLDRAYALVTHSTGMWIPKAEKNVAAAKDAIKNATAAPEREKATADLEKAQTDLQAGMDALKERQAGLKEAQKEEPAIKRELGEAHKAIAETTAATMDAVADLGVMPLLSSDKLDVKLARHSIIQDATPASLAAFAQQGSAQKDALMKMLGSDTLVVEMAIADGAKDGNYGHAAEIYRDILKASDKASSGNLRKLALAIALEFATPVKQNMKKADAGTEKMIDPVKRYLDYEKAFLDGELDPAFKDFSTWDYRMVVDGNESDDILAWGREMLRNYRPDQVTKPDYSWRYVDAVRTDIKYGSKDNKYDEPELDFFQNILKNGGVCGRRAFYGRFILRSFGIPTIARPQSGHAALAHWTPHGWVVNLGGNWGVGRTVTQYQSDLDFLASTQARALGKEYMKVKRAHWIADVMGEDRIYGLIGQKPGLWNAIALYTQADLISKAGARILEAVGQDIAEANETKEKVEIVKTEITAEDRKITTDAKGRITIPAAATSEPKASTGKIIFMESALGGKQLHYSRSGASQSFEYTFDAPAAGKYELTAKVVTPSWKQTFVVTLNGSAESVDLPLPHTVGMWEETEPVVVELKKGSNILRFSGEKMTKGASIHHFTLTPQ